MKQIPSLNTFICLIHGYNIFIRLIFFEKCLALENSFFICDFFFISYIFFSFQEYVQNVPLNGLFFDKDFVTLVLIPLKEIFYISKIYCLTPSDYNMTYYLTNYNVFYTFMSIHIVCHFLCVKDVINKCSFCLKPSFNTIFLKSFFIIFIITNEIINVILQIENDIYSIFNS